MPDGGVAMIFYAVDLRSRQYFALGL